ncbi:hypothetical protein BDV96DRAFT_367210 [Lophiotrema nucula]|uniref:Uncharacterized protein n=1 Tax=Lophiotrema nucula TaxID=690887 RepID=A0A6A5ZID1_9PLEO|nr:hypothetical protein BDV96DRAFT_367210 [Lophiotrema nucula]
MPATPTTTVSAKAAASILNTKANTIASTGQSLFHNARDLTKHLVIGAYLPESLRRFVPVLSYVLAGAGIGAGLTTYFTSSKVDAQVVGLANALNNINEQKLQLAIFHALKVLQSRTDFEDLLLDNPAKLSVIVVDEVEEMHGRHLILREEKHNVSSGVATVLSSVHADRLKKRQRDNEASDSGFADEQPPAPKRQCYPYQKNGHLAPPDFDLPPPEPLRDNLNDIEGPGVVAATPSMFRKDNPPWLQETIDRNNAKADQQRQNIHVGAARIPPVGFPTIPKLKSTKVAAPESVPKPETAVPDPEAVPVPKPRGWKGFSGHKYHAKKGWDGGYGLNYNDPFIFSSDSSSDQQSDAAPQPVKKQPYQAYVSEGSEESEEGQPVPSPPITRSQTKTAAEPVKKREDSSSEAAPRGPGAGARGTLAAARQQLNAQQDGPLGGDRFGSRKTAESQRLLFGNPVKVGGGSGVINIEKMKNTRYPKRGNGTDHPPTRGRNLSVIDEESTSTDKRPIDSLAVVDSFLRAFDRNQAEVDAVTREIYAPKPEPEKKKKNASPAQPPVPRRRKSPFPAASESSYRKPSSSASRKSSATWSSSSRKSSGTSGTSNPLWSLYPEYDSIYDSWNEFSEDEIQRNLNEEYPGSRRASSSSSRKSSKSSHASLPDLIPIEMSPPSRRTTHTSKASSRTFVPEPDDIVWTEGIPSADHCSPRVIIPTTKRAPAPPPARSRKSAPAPPTPQIKKRAAALAPPPTKKRARTPILPSQPRKRTRSRNPLTISLATSRGPRQRTIKKRAASAPPAAPTRTRKVAGSRVMKRKGIAPLPPASRKVAGARVTKKGRTVRPAASGSGAGLSYTQALGRGAHTAVPVKTFTGARLRRSSRIRDVVHPQLGELNERRLYKKAWRKGSR